MMQRIGAHLAFRVEGLDTVPAATARWARALFGPVPGGAASTGAAEITVRFEHGLGRGKGAFAPHPIAPRGPDLQVWTLGGRGAVVPLADPFGRPVLVDARMDLPSYLDWVHLPLLRSALWRQGACLLRAGAVESHGRRIGWSGPGGSGKTLRVVQALHEGAAYLGDDWLWITRDGTVGAVGPLIGVRDAHRPLLPPAARVPRGVLRRGVSRAAKILASTTTARSGVSAAFGLVADASRRAGFQFTTVHEAWPGAPMAEPGPLDVLEALGGDERAMRHDIAVERLAAGARLDSGRWALLEDALRLAFPGGASGRFPSMGQERRFLLEALRDTELRAWPGGGSR